MPGLNYVLYRSFWSALDLLFPPVCGGCGKGGSRWCAECQQRVRVLRGVLCEICGLPQENSGICDACLRDKPRFHALRSWSVFDEPVQSALHKLKYRRDMSLGEAIAFQMTPFVKSLDWHIDMIVPVPLGRQRIKERGYNQVAMIAMPLAMALEIRYAPNELARVRETRTQVGLSRAERHTNVRDAFQCGEGVKGKAVVIMDDVSTTGATLSAGAAALCLAGAKTVYALTVARALPHHGLRRV